MSRSRRMPPRPALPTVAAGEPGPYLIRSVTSFRKPLQLQDYDGTLLCPDGGVLFHALNRADFTRFPTKAAAEAAIARSLRWASLRNYHWNEESYEIQSVYDYELELVSPRRRSRTDPSS